MPWSIALLCLIWGSTWWAIRVCLTDQPPLTSAALRFLLAGGLMALAAPRLRRFEPAPPPPRWLWLSAAATSFAGSYGVLYVAEQHVSSGIAAVLWGVFPLLMAGSGHFLLGEQLRRRQVLGFLVSFAGIASVCADDLGGPASSAGWAAFLLLSPLLSAAGTTLVRRHGKGTSSVLLNRNGMLLGGALLAVFAAAAEQPAAAVFTPRATLAMIYLAVCGTALAFGLYFWLLRSVEAARLALITYVTPVLAMLLAAAVGDGEPGTGAWVGTALVTAGIALVVRRPARGGRQ